jgi:hypothetical protein
MARSTIQTLRPNVTHEEALRTFQSRGLTALYRRLRSGPLRRIADVYVPFWLYRVRYEMNGGTTTRIFAMDAVHGALDLFEFPAIPAADQLVSVRTRNLLRVQVEPAVAEEQLRTKVLRLVFQQGFFKLRHLRVEIERLPLDLHLPYWLAFYGHGEFARLRVMDAVRRRMEGGKASALFAEWLAA